MKQTSRSHTQLYSPAFLTGRLLCLITLVLYAPCFFTHPALAQEILGAELFESIDMGPPLALLDGGLFAAAVVNMGDIDGDGINDVAIGTPGDFDSATANHVSAADLVSPFGAVLTSISDQHFDGTRELAVGIPNRGTVALLSLKTDGSVNRARYFARTENGVEIPADPTSGLEGFGAGLAEIEDRDGDGIRELAVGSMFETNAEGQNGALWAINLCPEQACVLPVAIEPDEAVLPDFITLAQNFPNPFVQETTIDFSMPTEATIHLSLYDILGREVRVLLDERRPAGRHSVHFKAGALASGLYLYRLVAGDVVLGRMMVVGR